MTISLYILIFIVLVIVAAILVRKNRMLMFAILGFGFVIAGTLIFLILLATDTM